jgi:hypothetical protein
MLGSSQEFKEALLEELRVARSDVKVRIQAYHFDCEEVVQALDRSSVCALDVLVEERAAREAPRTISAIAKMKESGADVRYISGRDMTPLYGPGKGLFGIHHTKAVFVTANRYRKLWVGSANFTAASEYNHEIMIEITQLVTGPEVPLHPCLESFRKQFDNLHNSAELSVDMNRNRTSAATASRFQYGGASSSSGVPAPVTRADP